MEQRLDLSAAQRDSAAQIIAVHFEEFDAIRQRFQPEIQARLDTLRDDIAAILEPEQRQVWETQFERIRVAWQLGPLVPRDASEPGVSTSGTAAATGY